MRRISSLWEIFKATFLAERISQPHQTSVKMATPSRPPTSRVRHSRVNAWLEESSPLFHAKNCW